MRNRNYLWASIIPLGFALRQPVVKAEPEETMRGRRRWASPGRTRRGPADGSTRGWLKPRPKSTPRTQKRAIENAIRFAVQEAYVRVKAAEPRAALLRTTIVPQSEQTLEVSRAAYQTDRVDFLALIDNQRVLLSAQLSYYRALSDLEQGLADLERAVGREITPAMMTAVNTGEVK